MSKFTWNEIRWNWYYYYEPNYIIDSNTYQKVVKKTANSFKKWINFPVGIKIAL